MANFLENLGLDEFQKDEDSIMGLTSYVASKGKVIAGYGNITYINHHLGDAQLIGRIMSSEDKNVFVGLDTHSSGNCVWEVELSDICLTREEDLAEGQRLCVLKRAEDGDGMVVSHIVNAEVLPSYLDRDILKLQMIAFGVNFHYFVDDDAYYKAQPDWNTGKIGLENGVIFPAGLLHNGDPNMPEEERKHELNDLVTLKGVVKQVLWRKLHIGDYQEDHGYIGCIIDTQFGELEIIHAFEQIPESDRQNIKPGAIVSGVFVLQGDAAIYEYDKGSVYDEEHNLRLLRYSFVKGYANRTKTAFIQEAQYISKGSGKHFSDRDNIIEYIQFVHDDNPEGDNAYKAYMATICSIDENGDAPPEYAVGKRCVVLQKGTEYDSIAFIDLDDEGKISRLLFDTDPRYHFDIDKQPQHKSIWEDVSLPESVLDIIVNRARLQGVIDNSIDIGIITDDLEDYHAYRNNAELMLDNMGVVEDATIAYANLFGYLFAKEIERYANEQQENKLLRQFSLKVRYSISDMLEGKIRTLASDGKQEDIEKAMELGKQFYKDYTCFYGDNPNRGELIRSLIVVQRLGWLYAPKAMK